MAAYRDRVYGAGIIVMSLYSSLQGQSIWCKVNCNEFVWQLTGTEAIYVVYGASRLAICVTIDGLGELFGTTDVSRDKFHFRHSCTSRQSL